MANGIIRIENKPEIIPRGIIKTTDKIIVNIKNISFMGMLKIYKPAENSLTKTTTPNTIKRIENISIIILSDFIPTTKGTKKKHIYFINQKHLFILYALSGFIINTEIFF